MLEALHDLTSPRALVLRGGIEQRIAGREVVRSDLLLLSDGDRVAADAVLLSCNDFAADESLLTGESVAVRKIARESCEAMQPPGGDGRPFIYSGTLAVSGRGMARVLATGAHTEIGKIGRALQQQEIEATPLQKEIGRLVRRLAVIGVALSLLLLALYGFTRGDWLNGLLAGITLAMSILPEEYPVVLTIFMAMGAWRIARHRVLTRRVPTVEALGSATVLCMDKTGTLTQNRMNVRQLIADDAVLLIDGSAAALPEAFHELVEFAILASEAAPSIRWNRPFMRWERGTWPKPSTSTTTGNSRTNMRCRRRCCRIRTCGRRADARSMWWRPMARRRPSPTCASSTARGLHRGSAWPDIQHDFAF